MFIITKVEAIADGASVIARKDPDGRLHFSWSGTISEGARHRAEKRLAVALRNFDQTEPTETRQPLFGE